MKKLVILLSGKLKSGKNQVSTYLKDEFEKRNFKVKEDAFANKLKEDCVSDFKELFDFIRNKVEKLNVDNNPILNDLRIPQTNKMFEDKTPIVRKMFQLYGTEVFRNRVDKDWWVKALHKKVEDSTNDVILVTDCRFPNEIEGMFSLDFDTITIRLTRDINDDEKSKNHCSETALDNWLSWNYVIDNGEMNLKQLRKSVTTLVDDILSENTNIISYPSFIKESL